MSSLDHTPFNASDHLVDRHVREGRGDRVALRVGGESTTYAELSSLVGSVASGLAGLGVRAEERVALVLLDGVEFVAAFLATMRLGAIPLPLDPLLSGRDLALPASDAWARVAVVSSERVGVVAELVEGAPEIRDVVVAGQPAEALPHCVECHTFDGLLAGRRRIAPFPTREDSPGFWLCTSGTSGRPKLAMHRHADLRLAAEGYPREVLGLGSGDRCLSLAPLWHAYGLGNALAFPLAAGATAILEPTRSPSPALVAKLVRDEQPTLLFGTPAAYAALLASGLPAHALASVRHAASAGERLPGDVAAAFRDRFGVELLDGVGSTELLHIYLSNRPGSSRPGTVGRPVEGYRVRLEDADAAPVPPGTPGRLLVRGATMASGYWCRASATRQAFRGEWFDSGDMYVCSHDGVYTYLGRADEMFQVAGEWVAPVDVEAVLVEHAAVLEAVVVGEARADGVVEPVAYVVAEPGVTVDPAVLLEHCRRRLSNAQRPRRFVVIASLPRSGAGKVQRSKVADDARLPAAG